MDVIATRHQNFCALVDSRPGLTKRAIAIEMDIAPSYLSQLYGGKKLGDDVARKLEKTLGLSHGWMDVAHPEFSTAVNEPTASYGASQSLRTQPHILASAIALTRLACTNLDLPFDPEVAEDANLVILAINYLEARSESAVTVDNVVDFTKRLRQNIRGLDEAKGTSSARSAGRRAS